MTKAKGAQRDIAELKAIAIGSAVVLVFTAAMVGLAIAVAAAADVHFDDLSRDPTTVFDGPNYAGLYSNITTMLWQVSATAALLSAALLKATGRGRVATIFLTGGLLTAVMGIDDLFLIHQTLNDEAGLPLVVLPVLYAVGVAAFTWFARNTLRTNLVLVELAVGCWVLSLAGDVGLSVPVVLASGAKLAGIGFWTFMMLRLAFAELRGAMSGGAPKLAKAPVPVPVDPDPEPAAAEEPVAAPDPDDIDTAPVPAVASAPRPAGAHARRPDPRRQPTAAPRRPVSDNRPDPVVDGVNGHRSPDQDKS